VLNGLLGVGVNNGMWISHTTVSNFDIGVSVDFAWSGVVFSPFFTQMVGHRSTFGHHQMFGVNVSVQSRVLARAPRPEPRGCECTHIRVAMWLVSCFCWCLPGSRKSLRSGKTADYGALVTRYALGGKGCRPVRTSSWKMARRFSPNSPRAPSGAVEIDFTVSLGPHESRRTGLGKVSRRVAEGMKCEDTSDSLIARQPGGPRLLRAEGTCLAC